MRSLIAVPLSELSEEKHGGIICYPRFDGEEFRFRLKELRRLGVSAIEFSGKTRISDLSVLGKGHVSVVVVAYVDRVRYALKIRRVDADRLDMSREVEMLKMANKVGIGPRFYGATKNLILMELVEGVNIPEWVNTVKGRGRRDRVRKVLRLILEDCRRLDKAGLDHGELSRAPKHVIVEGDRPRIIDFESASTTRRAANVTSICQFLFIGSQVAESLRRILPSISRDKLIEALRGYKVEPTRERLKKILEVCSL